MKSFFCKLTKFAMAKGNEGNKEVEKDMNEIQSKYDALTNKVINE